MSEKFLDDDAIVQLYYQHPEEWVGRFKRLILTVQLVNRHGPIDHDSLEELVTDAYGHAVGPVEHQRDANALIALKMIEMNDQFEWVALPATDFWPFGF